MKKEIFTNKLKSNGTMIIDTPTESTWDGCFLSDFRSLKGLIQYIDFNCQINETGGCKNNPDILRYCCNDCLSNAGYFKIMLNRDIGFYSKIFSAKTGFWRKGKGCVIPHRMRSTTCLTHHCNHSTHKDFSDGMLLIREQLNSLRKRI